MANRLGLQDLNPTGPSGHIQRCPIVTSKFFRFTEIHESRPESSKGKPPPGNRGRDLVPVWATSGRRVSSKNSPAVLGSVASSGIEARPEISRHPGSFRGVRQFLPPRRSSLPGAVRGKTVSLWKVAGPFRLWHTFCSFQGPVRNFLIPRRKASALDPFFEYFIDRARVRPGGGSQGPRPRPGRRPVVPEGDGRSGPGIAGASGKIFRPGGKKRRFFPVP